MGTSYLWFYHDILQFQNSGKPHRIKIHVHLGIAQIALGPPPPHSNGHSVALFFGPNFNIFNGCMVPETVVCLREPLCKNPPEKVPQTTLVSFLTPKIKQMSI